MPEDDVGLDDLPDDYRTVGEVAVAIQNLVEDVDEFRNLWVKGEITGISPYDRHMYFTLKEEVDGTEHTISGVAFDYEHVDMPEDMADGDEVLVRGNVSVYTPQSKYQIKAREIKPAGLGELYQRYLELKEALDEEGLFDEDRKRDLPDLPRTIGIVTSDRGAAVRDVIDVARRRFPNVNLLLAPTAVQGQGAAPQIADAIELQNHVGRADVLIVGRGGGSLEDLWAFNEEEVARAIAGSEIPVVSAVGHETDTTIADLVADAVAPTPSAAAELAVPVKAELEEAVGDRLKRIARQARSTVRRGREMLEATVRRSGFAYPRRIVEDRAQRLDELRRRLAQGLEDLWASDREAFVRAEARLETLRPERQIDEARRDLADAVGGLEQAFEEAVADRRSRLAETRAALRNLSPLGVLDRGYTVVQRPDGSPVTRVEETEAGDDLDVRFADGTARTTVEEISDE